MVRNKMTRFYNNYLICTYSIEEEKEGDAHWMIRSEPKTEREKQNEEWKKNE